MECYGTCHVFGHLPGFVLPMCDGTIMKYLQNQNDQTALKLDLVREHSSILIVLTLNVYSKAHSSCVCRLLPTFHGYCPC